MDFTKTYLIVFTVDAIKARHNIKNGLQIDVMPGEYVASLIKEEGQKGKNFLSITKNSIGRNYYGFGLTIQEWRDHDATIKWKWLRFKGELKPKTQVTPKKSEPKTQQSSKKGKQKGKK